MTPEQYDRVADLFDRASELEPAAREAFVRGEARADTVVLDRVLAMLEADDGGSTTLRSPALGPGFHVDQFAGVRHPEQVAGFRILRLLGEGGMGRVYEGRQDHPRRPVAIKLLRRGMLGEEARGRFAHEADVLGRLQHPGIARIFEAGMADLGDGEQPYFAMELVAGRSLLVHAAQSRLSIPERIELMIRVCDAVEHAHRCGVVHRDLKPDNILVDESGQPRILDFGVARLTGPEDAGGTIRTSTGQLVGTLQYMSPEQCEAGRIEVDARADVYALGIILYELLCGRRPYDVSTAVIHEAVRIIREQSPMRPGALDRALRGDLETILLKALDKNRDRRYASAGELGDDLRRHRRDEPILARPPSTIYQLGKLARRHRAATIGAGAVAVVLVAGTVVSTTFAVFEGAARQEAQERFDELEAGNAFLEEMLQQADPWESGGEVTIRAAMERASALAGDSFRDRPNVEARVRMTIGEVWLRLGDHTSAEPHLRAAERLHLALHGPADPRTVHARARLVELLTAANELDEAAALGADALPLATAALGSDDPAVLELEKVMGMLTTRQGAHEDALVIFDRLVAERERTLGPDHDETLAALELRARALIQLGRPMEAATTLRHTEARHGVTGGGDSPRRLRSLAGLGRAQLDLAAFDDAEATYTEAIDVARNVFGDDHPQLAECLAGLASVYEQTGRAEQAAPLRRESSEMYRDGLGPGHPFTLIALTSYGGLLANLGRMDEARAILEENLRTQQRLLGDGHIEVAPTHSSLGVLAFRAGDMEAAAAHFADAIAVYEQDPSGISAAEAGTRANLALVLSRLGRPAEAVGVLQPAIDYQRASLGPDHPYLSDDLRRVAELHMEAGHPEPALAPAREALAIAERRGDDDRRLARSHCVHGEALIAVGRTAEGVAAMETAHAGFTAMERWEDAQEIAESLANLFDAAGAPGDPEAADLWRERAAADEAAAAAESDTDA